MTNFYIRLSDLGSTTMSIIDEDTLDKAERGENYLDPDDYDFICEAETLEEADDYYWNVWFQDYASSRYYSPETYILNDITW